MNKKDLAYLKRRLNVEHCHITSIRGLYVNGRKEPVSAFEVLPVRTSKEDMEKYCAIFKRVLSGEDAQNLLTVDFTPEQVISGEEYGLLTELKDCAIHNDELTDAFFEKVCACLPQMEDQHYLILLMHDACDIRHHNSDGSDDEGLSDTIFHYILCAVCPVKRNKPALCYDAGENLFTISTVKSTVSSAFTVLEDSISTARSLFGTWKCAVSEVTVLPSASVTMQRSTTVSPAIVSDMAKVSVFAER